MRTELQGLQHYRLTLQEMLLRLFPATLALNDIFQRGRPGVYWVFPSLPTQPPLLMVPGRKVHMVLHPFRPIQTRTRAMGCTLLADPLQTASTKALQTALH